MKKISLFLSLLTLLSISSCTPKIDKLSFEKNEYIVHSGEKISVVQNVSDVNYLIIGKMIILFTLMKRLEFLNLMI